MIRFLDLAAQYENLKSEIDAALSATITGSAFIGGAGVARFESEFAAYQNAECCVGVGNGTDALEISIEALDLPPRSDIIVPANSFIASSEAVTRAGHNVVFADVDADTFLLDPHDVEKRLTENTAAIMAVHLYGQPCDLEPLLKMSETHDLRIIEDSAQAHGAETAGRRVGAIGDVGTFSFYPGKNLGAYGDAGAIVTNDPKLAKKCRMIANHGRLDKYDHAFEGRNSRLDGIQAAILSVKLRHLDEWIEHRNRVAAAYSVGLDGIDGLKIPRLRIDVRHSFHLYVVRTDRRDELASYLAEREIQTGIHYPVSLPRLRAYRHLGQADDAMVANRQDATLLSLPIGEHLNEGDVAHVIDSIKDFYS